MRGYILDEMIFIKTSKVYTCNIGYSRITLSINIAAHFIGPGDIIHVLMYHHDRSHNLSRHMTN